MPVILILQEYIPGENEQPPMPTAEVENIRLIGEGDRQKLSDTVRQRIGEPTIRQNAVLCVEMLLTKAKKKLTTTAKLLTRSNQKLLTRLELAEIKIKSQVIVDWRLQIKEFTTPIREELSDCRLPIEDRDYSIEQLRDYLLPEEKEPVRINLQSKIKNSLILSIRILK